MAKDKKSKPRKSLAMAIAHGFNFGQQLAGVQLSYAYPIALSLSTLAISVGLSAQIVQRYPELPIWLAIPGAVVIAVMLAFCVDYMAIGSLKRLRLSNSRWTQFFSVIFMLAGISFSAVASDSFWTLIFLDWKAPFFAIAVNVVILSTELWPHEHKLAVKESSQRSDVVTHSTRQETRAMTEDLQREATYEVFKDPDFRTKVKGEFAKDAIRLVVAQMNESIGASESPEPAQLDAPASVEQALPAPSDKPQSDQQEAQDDLTKPAPLNTSTGVDEAPEAKSDKGQSDKSEEETDVTPTSEPTTGPLPRKPNLQLVKFNDKRTDKRSETQMRINYAYEKLLRDTGTHPSASAVAREIDMSRQTVSTYAPFSVTDKLDLTLWHMRANPQIADEELAGLLSLTRPASARFWRLKALDMIMEREPAARVVEIEEVEEEASNE